MEINQVYQEDCIEGMKKIPSNSIDLVLTDPPYGITACEWDKLIDLEEFWVEIKRIIKPNGAIVMTASQPFTTDLINSNREMFKYELIWEKEQASNFMNLKNEIGKIHENIIIFTNGKIEYNPQMIFCGKPSKSGGKNFIKTHSNFKGGIPKREGALDRFPTSIIKFNRDRNGLHPTQKPVELFKYLIKTYSNENQLVLDCFGGSGTTAIACIETNRQYILFENNPQYFKIINDRIQLAKSQTK